MKNIFIITIITLMAFLNSCGNTEYLNISKVDIPNDIVSIEKYYDVSVEPHTVFENKSTTSEWIPLSRYAGAIDPVGTDITKDFDGDGIPNDKEDTGNIWVANYPVISTYISYPVTMNIKVDLDTNGNTKTITSEITDSDVEDNKNKSSEDEHKNDVNLKTVQFKDKAQGSQSSSLEMELSVSAFVGPKNKPTASASVDAKFATSQSSAFNNETTKWKDVPFKNNTDKMGWSLKNTSAARNSRNARQQSKDTNKDSLKITPNSGYVRASLYITNESVNMPVKLTNILCSLMFKTPEGQLIPVQSFRLRNQDYSLFEIELYGGSTFGPYVVEINNLNTALVKDAISKGYNPKIYIIDYKMRHVKDSNYKSTMSDLLSNENLKIIEENTKGRTAGFKFVAPGLRKFFRVVAFDSNLDDENNTGDGITMEVRPGVSMDKALKRISYSGTHTKFRYYLLDFSNLNKIRPDSNIKIPNVIIKTIESVDGVENRIPLGVTIDNKIITKIDFDGNVVADGDEDENTIYVMKPIYDNDGKMQWTPEDFNMFRMWNIYADGRYFYHFADKKITDPNDSSKTITKTVPFNGKDIIVVKGVEDRIWPGDHYDLVCIEFKEYIEAKTDYGKNPIQSEKIVKLSTRWDKSILGNYPFYPNVKSEYLGEAVAGDKIRLTVKLNKTTYLDPKFTSFSTDGEGRRIWQDFTYNMNRENLDIKYDAIDALDLEISYGSGGDHDDWEELTKYLDDYGDDMYTNPFRPGFASGMSYSWDYINQIFNIEITVPSGIPGVGDDGIVQVYIRSAPKEIYKNALWPKAGQGIQVVDDGSYMDKTVLDQDNNTIEWKNILLSDYKNYFDTSSSDLPIYVPVDETDTVVYHGLDVQYIIANWLGYRNFSNPNWNKWSNAYTFNDMNDSTTDIIDSTKHPFLNVDYENNDVNFFTAPLFEREYEVNVQIVGW